MLKAIINGVEKDIVRIPMIGDDSTYKEGWEIRDQQDRLIWGKDNTLTGVSSISFRGYGVPLKSIKIVGNTQQNGTPSPDAPIMPTFCGERTGNLAPTIGEDSGWRVGYLTNQGTYTNNNPRGEILSPMISLSGIASFTISASNYSVPSMSVYYFNGATFISNQGATDYGGSVFDNFPSGATHFCFAIRTGYQTIDSVVNHGWRVMLNSGSTALPYEPYGYKIPITCAGQTVPIYLGEVPTVRRIKKLVLDGTESAWQEYNNLNLFRVTDMSLNYRGQKDGAICDSLPLVTRNELTTNTFCWSSGTIGELIININNYNLADLKAYLNSNPITIWYVLAEPTTSIVNEPLAKIGDYADELHSTDAGVSIPTTEGSNTLSIDTTLHPSNIEITGHIKSHTVYVMTYIDYTDMTKSYTIGDVNKVNAFTQRRRCNMLDDGTITAYYGDPTFVEDGSNGQVMVYQPKFYYKVEPVLLNGIKIRKCKYYISDYQLPGYKLHPAFIDRTDPNNLKEFPFVCIGAYEGCLQNGDTYITDDSASSTSYKLSSIAFTDTATNGVKPSSGVISPFGTIGNYETTASNRGTGWHIENIWITSMNQLMFVIEMCNPNSQTALGSGVTNIPDTPNTANNASLVGSTSSLGNGSGRATTTYSNYNGTTTAQTAADKTSVSYRGMENPFGNTWKWVDGMTIKNTSAIEHTPYICKSFAYTRNSTLTNYDMVNVTIPGNGYVTAFGYDPNFDWLFISAETNSSNTGSIRDYLYTTNSGYTCARLGGSWAYGARAGLFYWYLDRSSDGRYRNISARICYLPQ